MSTVSSTLKKTAGIFAAAIFALVFAMGTCCPAWAESTEQIFERQAGNLLGSSESDSSVMGDYNVDRDFYWAGSNLELNKVKTGGDIVVAGMNIDLINSQAKGSIRVAGMNLTLKSVTAENNFTVAGMKLDLNQCDAKGAVMCAGQDITYSGTAGAAMFAGETVTINGTIKGNLHISADNVTFGPNANVKGKIAIESNNKANISEKAHVGSIEYTESDAPDTEEAAEAIAAAGAFAILMSKVIGFVGTIVFALLLVWLFRRPVEDATQMTRTRAGRIFATGAIFAIVAPLAIGLLFALVVTIPVAVALVLALIALTFACVPFAAASLSRLVFPKMNRFGAAAIGALVLALVGAIPFIGVLVTVAAFMYLTGYIVQVLWNGRGPKEPAPLQAAPTPAAAPETPAPEPPTPEAPRQA